jgi:hypothetical protein
MDQKTIKKLFYLGVALFSLGVVAVFLGYAVPGPMDTPTYGVDGATYFWPFLNYATIGGIALAIVALFMQKKGKKNEV